MENAVGKIVCDLFCDAKFQIVSIRLSRTPPSVIVMAVNRVQAARGGQFAGSSAGDSGGPHTCVAAHTRVAVDGQAVLNTHSC